MNNIYNPIYVGKMKTSIARLKFYENAGKNLVNKVELEKFFGTKLIWQKIFAPFKLCDINLNICHFKVNVHGGGFAGQTAAIQRAIAKFLLNYNPTLKPILKKEKLLSCALKKKERKKYGLKKARKAPQFSKR